MHAIRSGGADVFVVERVPDDAGTADVDRTAHVDRTTHVDRETGARPNDRSAAGHDRPATASSAFADRPLGDVALCAASGLPDSTADADAFTADATDAATTGSAAAHGGDPRSARWMSASASTLRVSRLSSPMRMPDNA